MIIDNQMDKLQGEEETREQFEAELKSRRGRGGEQIYREDDEGLRH